jgi:hypothetical protein
VNNSGGSNDHHCQDSGPSGILESCVLNGGIGTNLLTFERLTCSKSQGFVHSNSISVILDIPCAQKVNTSRSFPSC